MAFQEEQSPLEWFQNQRKLLKTRNDVPRNENAINKYFHPTLDLRSCKPVRINHNHKYKDKQTESIWYATDGYSKKVALPNNSKRWQDFNQ